MRPVPGAWARARWAIRSCAAVTPRAWPFAVRASQLYEQPLTRQKLQALRAFLALLEATDHLAGDVVECGVWIGRSLALLSDHLRRRRSPRAIHAFDSFAGFPAPAAPDYAPGAATRMLHRGYLGDTTEARVRAKLRRVGMAERVILHPGYFADTLPAYRPAAVSFVHVDCDLYESTRVCLAELWPRLAPGGIMVLDDWALRDFPGARRAIDEWEGAQAVEPLPGSPQAGWVRKPP